MRHLFKQFLDDLPDCLFDFIQDNRIINFKKLIEYTEEDLIRKRIKLKDIHHLSALLALYGYELTSHKDSQTDQF